MKRVVWLAVLGLGLARADAASAQGACEPPPLPAATTWSAPLDRPLTLHAGEVPLTEALSRITTAARLHLSYSRDLLPARRQVCLEFTAAPVGAVLASILSGTSVAPVVGGHNRVVLAAEHPNPGLGEGEELPDVVVLEGLDVAAEPVGPGSPPGVVVSSIEGRLLEQQGATSLADALDGLVPGVWVWARGSTSAVAQYASIRGASSFGLSAPKLYIDGLEVANPLLVSTLDPATIERIEVLRGPQGAALFGADAIAGVTHIITRQGALDASGSRAQLRTGIGLTGSAFAPAGALEQEHGISLFAGRPGRSARLDLAFNSLGEYVPDAASRRLSAVGSARSISDRFALTATARYLSEDATLAESPLLQDLLGLTAASRDLAVGQYTLGATAAWRPGEHWTHTLIAGINGYRLGGAPNLAEARSAADSALAAAGTSASRTTLRLTSAAALPLGPGAAGNLTFSAEHSALRQDGGIAVAPWWEQAPHRYGGTMVRPYSTPEREDYEVPEYGEGAVASELERERSSSGVSARFDATLRDRLNLSAGLRLEHTTLETGAGAGATLPSLGASWTAISRGSALLVLRAAYGKGVRWPQAPSVGGFARQLQLLPEVQAGTEGGVDLALGRTLSLQATRFHQVATGLTQQVAVTRDSTAWRPASTVLLAQNVGEIANRGWELAAVTHAGPLTLSGTLSLVDSHVRSLAGGYHGDLAAGDRMLGVPARTMSLSALWAAPHWSASLAASRASDWLSYDRLALARAEADSVPLTTAQLRGYWLHYDGTTRLRASLSRDLGERLTLRLTGDNLLDVQTGDPDNATVSPGRSLSLTVRARL